MVEAYAERTAWRAIPDSTPPTGGALDARLSRQLRLLPPVDLSRPADRTSAEDPFERAGLRVGRAIGRLGLRLRTSAGSPPPAAVHAARAGREGVAPTPGDLVGLRPAAGPAPSAPGGIGWRQVKRALEVVDGVPPLRAVADALLGPWGLDLLVVGAAAVGLLYPASPLGIATGHADLLDLALPLLKTALAVVLSPLAVEVALALLGIGRLLWSRRSPAPRAGLGA